MINECFLDCGFTGSYKAKARLVNKLLALIKKHEKKALGIGFERGVKFQEFEAKLKGPYRA